jgi:hypothetical protein
MGWRWWSGPPLCLSEGSKGKAMDKVQVQTSSPVGGTGRQTFEATTWQIDSLGVLTIEGEKVSESGPVKYTHVASFNVGVWLAVERLTGDE